MTAHSTPQHATSARPSDKVAAAALGGAVTTVILFLVSQMGFEATPELAAALTTIVAALAGYFRPERHPTT